MRSLQRNESVVLALVAASGSSLYVLTSSVRPLAWGRGEWGSLQPRVWNVHGAVPPSCEDPFNHTCSAGRLVCWACVGCNSLFAGEEVERRNL